MSKSKKNAEVVTGSVVVASVVVASTRKARRSNSDRERASIGKLVKSLRRLATKEVGKVSKRREAWDGESASAYAVASDAVRILDTALSKLIVELNELTTEPSKT